MIPLRMPDPDAPTGELTLDDAARQARDQDRRWFTHPRHPGRVLPSESGGNSWSAPWERFCLHGDPLSGRCGDCPRDMQWLYGTQQAAA